MRQWLEREQRRAEFEGRTGPRYSKWYGGVILYTCASLTAAYGASLLDLALGLIVVAAAFGGAIWIYYATGTAWGWASWRLWDRDRDPDEFRSNVVGLVLCLMSTVGLLVWVLSTYVRSAT